MILSCPACATRYRHESLPIGSPARCGQCDRVFPVPPTRSYFVLAVSPARQPLVAASAGALVAGSFAPEPPRERSHAAPAPPVRRRPESFATPAPSGARAILQGAAVGMVAGFALAYVLYWPMTIWAGMGAGIGLVGSWGWRRWTSERP